MLRRLRKGLVELQATRCWIKPRVPLKHKSGGAMRTFDMPTALVAGLVHFFDL